jgi:uncharacterized protein YecT (DUF1311 family)
MSLRIAGVVLLSVLPALAAAQEVTCDAALTQADMNACARADWEQADGALNALWPRAREAAKAQDAALPDDMKRAGQALLEAQRAWIAFRDAQCRSEGFAMRGGSAEPLLVYGCMATMTRLRTEELQRLIDGY